jgi:hypothetical protein
LFKKNTDNNIEMTESKYLIIFDLLSHLEIRGFPFSPLDDLIFQELKHKKPPRGVKIPPEALRRHFLGTPFHGSLHKSMRV